MVAAGRRNIGGVFCSPKEVERISAEHAALAEDAVSLRLDALVASCASAGPHAARLTAEILDFHAAALQPDLQQAQSGAAAAVAARTRERGAVYNHPL